MPGNDWRVDELAKLLCRCHGHDPEKLVVNTREAGRGPFSSVALDQKHVYSSWMLYRDLASTILDSLDRSQ